MANTLNCEVLVVGSGPSGAVTAAMLAEAGRDVLLVEEGPNLTPDSAANFSYAEMDQKYRNGGLTTTFGKTNITYIEGRCVGGASEINAALYHRPIDEVVDGWARDFSISDFSADSLGEHFQVIEDEVRCSGRPYGFSPASMRLKQGADALGWKEGEIERFWRFDEEDGRWGRRQSMSRTCVPRAVAAGCRLEADLRVRKLIFKGNRAVAACARRRARDVKLTFDTVVLCCGAVQTPTMLRRSGVTKGIGDSLQLHPMVRIAARFDDVVNDPAWGVPVRQVSEFKPELTLGCSHSSLPHIALWLGQEVEDRRAILANWDHVAVFYAAVCGKGTGTVRALPLLDEPLIRYEFAPSDMGLLGEGLVRLGELVLAAGAKEIFSPFEGQPGLSTRRQVEKLRRLPSGTAINVTTIHLFSSCPMGEDERCPVDSHGRVKGLDNVRIHDSSLLPTSPGVNPQGTIMAIARRNTAHLLGG
ncbi:MAG TPA: GMC family oxidoreductase [Myxococcota bacterium]|nr:GMC family oxidoreductase [Myxococcota bacterium]